MHTCALVQNPNMWVATQSTHERSALDLVRGQIIKIRGQVHSHIGGVCVYLYNAHSSTSPIFYALNYIIQLQNKCYNCCVTPGTTKVIQVHSNV